METSPMWYSVWADWEGILCFALHTTWYMFVSLLILYDFVNWFWQHCVQCRQSIIWIVAFFGIPESWLCRDAVSCCLNCPCAVFESSHIYTRWEWSSFSDRTLFVVLICINWKPSTRTQMVRLQQSYSPHSGVLPERAAHFAVGYAVECRDGRGDSRDRDHSNGGPSLFQPGDRIVDEYSKEEFHVDQFLGKVCALSHSFICWFWWCFPSRIKPQSFVSRKWSISSAQKRTIAVCASNDICIVRGDVDLELSLGFTHYVCSQVYADVMAHN